MCGIILGGGGGGLNNIRYTQAIPGNDQNSSPTSQKTARRKLDRTSQLMALGGRFRKLFRWFFGANMFAGMSSQILGEKFDI